MNPFEPEQEGIAPIDYGGTVNSHTESISDIEWALNRLKDRYASMLLSVEGLQNIQDNTPAVSQTIVQANTFVRGNVIFYNPVTSLYEKSKADAENTAECCGIVTSADSDIFTVVTSGTIDLSDLGLLDGYIYYVSPTNAGALTLTKPLTVTQVQKPILLVLKSGISVVVNMRGMVVEQMIDQHVDTTSDVTHKSLILTDLTASTALVTDASKEIVSSATTATELGYVHDVTSPIQTQLGALTTYNTLIGTITNEPTGFDVPENVVVTYDSTTQKITLSGTGWAAYYKGVLISALTTGYVSTAHTNTTGHTYFLYYNGSGFAWSTDTFPGFKNVLIACVYYRAANPFALRECHGLMQWQTHQNEHYTVGTYRVSGADISNIVLDSTTADNRRPIISECVIQDEDLPTTNVALTSKSYSQRYITNTEDINYNLAANDIVPLSTNNPYYNSWNGSAFIQTLMPNNSVMTVWLYEVPVTADAQSQSRRHVFVQGQTITQATSSSAGALVVARNTEKLKTTQELVLGGIAALSIEYVCVHKFIVQYSSSNWTITDSIRITGTKASQVGQAAGNYLSLVETNATLTGLGTPTSPLSVTQSYVLNTGNETVAGIKTFSSFPLTPSSAPTTDYQTANKKYVDDNAGSAHIIQEEGSSLSARTYLNFIGGSVTASDDVGNDATIVTISNNIDGGSSNTVYLGSQSINGGTA